MTILNLPGRIAISRPYSGEPSEAGKARRFVAAALDSAEDARTTDVRGRGGHPCRDDAVQLIGELIAESLRHASACGSRAGYTVSVRATGGWSRVTLSTQACGCWTSPELTRGRGVHLVDLFTARWGVSASRGGVTVWFELGHEELSPTGPGRVGTDGVGTDGVGTDGVGTDRLSTERVGTDRVATERVGTERGAGDPRQR